MNSTYYRGGFLEKIEKTIAMITASLEYRQYVKKLRQRAWNDSMTDFEGGTRAKRFKGLNVKESPCCVKCGEYLVRRSAMKMCRPCRRSVVIAAYRSGLSTAEVALRFNVTETTIYNNLRDKSRPKKTVPVVSERIPVMV